MMKYSANEFDRAKAQMARDLNAAITGSKDLLEAAAPPGDERAKFAENPGSARATVGETTQSAAMKVSSAAAAARDYVGQSPWSAVAIAAAAGMLIGFLAARR